jgi:hypothetical protein
MIDAIRDRLATAAAHVIGDARLWIFILAQVGALIYWGIRLDARLDHAEQHIAENAKRSEENLHKLEIIDENDTRAGQVVDERLRGLIDRVSQIQKQVDRIVEYTLKTNPPGPVQIPPAEKRN